MNRDNILAVADAIERHAFPDLGFNMNTFGGPAQPQYGLLDQSGHNCGTVACIAGWAAAVAGETKRDPEVVAADYLDLTDHEAHDLFFATNSDLNLDDIKPAQAVAVLRHLAETGEVDWDV